MKVLVTGSTGFVGSNLCQRLDTLGYDVVRMSRTTSKDNSQSIIIDDLSGSTDFKDSLVGIDTIVHCAARAHVMAEDQIDPLNVYRQINTHGTAALARQAAQSGVKRFIFISSIKVNGESTNNDKPFEHNSEHNPSDSYALSKSEAEKALLEIASNTGMELVVIRPTLVYGPGVKANFSSLMRLVSKRFPLPFASITGNKRSLVSVSNLVDLIATCIEHPRAAGQTFLVSDDHDISTSEMITQMAKALGNSNRQVPFPIGCYRLIGTLLKKQDVVERLLGSLQVDIAHTKQTLDWAPPQTLEEGFLEAADSLRYKKKI
ncbi:UDP-glucose 4-epimerase family protein [Vibrio sp. WXL210]|uniref:UDP-glucose 4-epimerase family protein n=1 Tax=Vibrio sp. WXL210 TaxID=3450709 RepID=UPI003EC4A591